MRTATRWLGPLAATRTTKAPSTPSRRVAHQQPKSCGCRCGCCRARRSKLCGQVGSWFLFTVVRTPLSREPPPHAAIGERATSTRCCRLQLQAYMYGGRRAAIDFAFHLEAWQWHTVCVCVAQLFLFFWVTEAQHADLGQWRQQQGCLLSALLHAPAGLPACDATAVCAALLLPAAAAACCLLLLRTAVGHAAVPRAVAVGQARLLFVGGSLEQPSSSPGPPPTPLLSCGRHDQRRQRSA
jgi:hypothetical protein